MPDPFSGIVLKVKEPAFFILVIHKTIHLLQNKWYVQALSTNNYLFLCKTIEIHNFQVWLNFVLLKKFLSKVYKNATYGWAFIIINIK